MRDRGTGNREQGTTNRRSSMVDRRITNHESRTTSPRVATHESRVTGVEVQEAVVPSPQSLVPSLSVEVAGIRFAHPVLAAPGPLGFGREVSSVVDLGTFAGFMTKSVTVEPRAGNPHPQLVQTDAGWLNSLGLPNHGLAAFITKQLPFLRTLGIPIIVSAAGETVQDFVTLAEWLSQEEGIAALELNVSCPNTDCGLIFGVDPNLTHELVARVRAATPLPLIVKLTPNVTDIVPIARAAEEGGADALSLINALTGLAIDVHTRRPKLGAITGGLTGPAIRPVAVRMVWQVVLGCSLPVIGMGGVATAEDALEFLIAGARAVAVGSAVIDRPAVAAEIHEGLLQYLTVHGMSDISEVIGTLQLGKTDGRSSIVDGG